MIREICKDPLFLAQKAQPAGPEDLPLAADLLETLMRHPGQLMGRSVLLGRVWGMDAPVEEGSLDSYIHFVRRRLKAVGAKETVSTVRGAGYRLEASSC